MLLVLSVTLMWVQAAYLGPRTVDLLNVLNSIFKLHRPCSKNFKQTLGDFHAFSALIKRPRKFHPHKPLLLQERKDFGFIRVAA